MAVEECSLDMLSGNASAAAAAAEKSSSTSSTSHANSCREEARRSASSSSFLRDLENGSNGDDTAVKASSEDELSLQASAMAHDFISVFNSMQSTGQFVAPGTNAFGQAFRVYSEGESARRSVVEEFYRTNHINQTYDFALAMRNKHCKLDKAVMSIWECCELLNEYVDESDPDLDEPQIEHLLQTAEAIRRDYPDEDWFHLTGLIHDLGKVLLHPKFGEEPQWAVVGDTFPLGCAFDSSIVHSEFFTENPDSKIPKYNSKFGIYSERCGLDNVIMSWGHDEFMYQVLKLNGTELPPQALFIIRYHSFYALHRAGKYTHFLNDFDEKMLPWLKRFNQYDLYSKSKVRIDVEAVKPYYMSLIEKYLPGTLRW